MSKVVELTERQMAVFMIVQAREPIMTSQIAEAIGIRSSSVLNSLKKLESNGKISRYPPNAYCKDISWMLPRQ